MLPLGYEFLHVGPVAADEDFVVEVYLASRVFCVVLEKHRELVPHGVFVYWYELKCFIASTTPGISIKEIVGPF